MSGTNGSSMPAGARRSTRVRPGARDDAGAIALVAAAVMTALVVIAGFTVDLGMQRVLRRDLQSVADVVSLDLARLLDGTPRSATLRTEFDRQRDLSVERNDATVLGRDLDVDYELGRVDQHGAFSTIAPGQVPTAVRVTASGVVDFAFHGDSGSSSRTAIASARPFGCFSVGTFSVRANLGDSWLLGGLLGVLGTDVRLDVLDIDGLASTSIDLLGLVGADAGVASFDELLDTSLGLADFYLLTAKALERESGRTAEVGLLEDLAQLDLPHLDLTLGELVEIDTAGAEALGARVNLLDLVTGAAFIANGTNVVSVPGLGVDLGITNLDISLHIGQKPILTCGPVGTRAEASQVRVVLSGRLVNLDLGLLSLTSPIRLEIKLAAAEGTITALECTPTSRRVSVLAANGLLDIDIALQARLVLLPALFGGVTLLDVPIDVSTQRSSPDAVISLPVPDSGKGDVVETGQHTLGVPTLAVDTSGLRALGLPLGQITDGIISPLLTLVLNPLIATLDRYLLSPLLDLLGVNVAGADYYATAPVDCGIPKLVG
ncbi:pilus assembly protein TadG-related protein [Nocardioides sp. R-C-SC26]|uniref:pilus assembly protein TadG-related protein n=1 Tax=Nocardioides sp. R-C-SC26 TaxID=2870414 RepID=UPI001E41F8B0|nr:pilus assembly protein TadG-related protein [Nocardioides sp. R-C-SC26]